MKGADKNSINDQYHFSYITGIKYQITRDYATYIPVYPNRKISTDHISLDIDGFLYIKKTYGFDGPSGPTMDLWFPKLYKKMLRGSLIHDALYELMRHDLLDRKVWRKEADAIFRISCLEDGMVKIRADWCYIGVRIGGYSSSLAKNKRKEEVAP